MTKGRPFDREKAILIYRTMINYQLRTGFNMSLREIADNLGYKSHSAVHPYITWLTENGFVKSKGRQIRAIPYDEKVRYEK